MKCFYHSSDLDGVCSAAIIKNEFTDCEMIPINYGEEFPWSIIERGEVVYMVDFCLQNPFGDMILLNEACNLIWIDHHKSAIESHKEHLDIYPITNRIDGLRRIGIGACALVWEYLYPQRQLPKAVESLAKYDVWDHSDPYTLPFQYGMRLENLTPKSELWIPLLTFSTDYMFDKIKDNGEVILKYEKQYNEKYVNACYFEIVLETQTDNYISRYKCVVINKALASSKLFDSIWDPEEYDIMITFCWMKDKWVVSLYTEPEKTGIDVSEIAKIRGGGGHKGAAGFTCEELPFKLK